MGMTLLSLFIENPRKMSWWDGARRIITGKFLITDAELQSYVAHEL